MRPCLIIQPFARTASSSSLTKRWPAFRFLFSSAEVTTVPEPNMVASNELS